MSDILTHDVLKTLLLESGVVEAKDLELAEERWKSEGGTFAQALLWYNLVSEEELGKLMADALRVPFVVLGEQSIDPAVLALVPEIVANKQRVMAFALDQDGVHVAMTHPGNLEIRSFLEKKLGLPVRVSLAMERDLENALMRYRQGVTEAFEELILSDMREAGDKSRETDPPIIRIVDTLIKPERSWWQKLIKRPVSA
jgi:hypothetical protein